MLWLFYIWSSRQAQLHNSGLIRDIFSKAIECAKSRHHSTVWFYAIMFEIEQKEYANAKSLVFQAIKECPWSKGAAIA